jgi:hypothetical protein
MADSNLKLIPKYSYDYNIILNDSLSMGDEQLKNFASLLSDKDRFLDMLPLIEKNFDLIEKKLGHKLKEEIEFFVVRAEKFKSFSEPITIEYSMLPEEMIVFLLKEIIKVLIEGRFLDEISQEQYINSFVEYIIVNGDFEKTTANDSEGKSLGGSQTDTFVKLGKNLHDESLRLYEGYEFKEIDFTEKTMAEYMEEIYSQSFN